MKNIFRPIGNAALAALVSAPLFLSSPVNAEIRPVINASGQITGYEQVKDEELKQTSAPTNVTQRRAPSSPCAKEKETDLWNDKPVRTWVRNTPADQDYAFRVVKAHPEFEGEEVLIKYGDITERRVFDKANLDNFISKHRLCNGISEEITFDYADKKAPAGDKQALAAGNLERKVFMFDVDGDRNGISEKIVNDNGHWLVSFNNSGKYVTVPDAAWLYTRLADHFGNVDGNFVSYNDQFDTTSGLYRFKDLIEEGHNPDNVFGLVGELAQDMRLNSSDLVRLYGDMALSRFGAEEVITGDMNMKDASDVLADRKNLAQIYLGGIINPVGTVIDAIKHPEALTYNPEAAGELYGQQKAAQLYWRKLGKEGPINSEDLKLGGIEIYQGLKEYVRGVANERDYINYGGQ